MMTLLRKLIPVEVKELGNRQLEIAGSTEDEDRMHDVIKASGWKLGPFKKNPVFMWGHDYSQPPIGRALKVWIDKETKRLMFNVEFADAETYEFADTIYKLYKGGFLHATSVGFIPLNWEGKDEDNPNPKYEGNVFTKQELLELSAVPVPANPNALVTARDSGLITVKEFDAFNKEAEATKEPVEDPAQPMEDRQGEVEQTEVITDVKTPEETEPSPTEGPEDKNVAEPEIPEPKEVSQGQLRDDIDYLHKAIMKAGMNEGTEILALDMASEIIQRYMGNDIPTDIIDKVGAVLNAKNKGRLSQIQELAQAVLDSAATDDSDKQLEADEPTPNADEPTPNADELTKQRTLEVAAVAELVIAKLKGKRIY